MWTTPEGVGSGAATAPASFQIRRAPSRPSVQKSEHLPPADDLAVAVPGRPGHLVVLGRCTQGHFVEELVQALLEGRDYGRDAHPIQLECKSFTLHPLDRATPPVVRLTALVVPDPPELVLRCCHRVPPK